MRVADSILKGLEEAIDYQNGVGKARRMKVSVSPLPCYKAESIKEIRSKIGLSQASFSSVLGVSKKTIEAWEAGKCIPQGPAQRMLELIDKKPNIVENYIKTR
jgi:putative transcriptional regulator